MKSVYTVIRYPLLTEKGTYLASQNKYLFCVEKRASKIEIKKAIEEIYKVKVVAVNTLSVHGKRRRIRQNWGKTPEWKKAIVTLKEGEQIKWE
ncbi:MAG: 50S ribosomal protein L23 [Candidatus Omnitrophota bacterium]|nr:MAG: 50S ribosomal protein L23 [Candidatus Omnitrophota bacterium]